MASGAGTDDAGRPQPDGLWPTSEATTIPGAAAIGTPTLCEVRLDAPATPHPPQRPTRRARRVWDWPVEDVDQVLQATAPLPTVRIPPPSGDGTLPDRAVWRALAAQYPWPVEDALRVIYGPTPPNEYAPNGCPNGESGGDAGAESPGGHRGLFQLASLHAWRFEAHGWTWDDAFVAERNMEIAYEIWQDSAWIPWSCKP